MIFASNKRDATRLISVDIYLHAGFRHVFLTSRKYRGNFRLSVVGVEAHILFVLKFDLSRI